MTTARKMIGLRVTRRQLTFLRWLLIGESDRAMFAARHLRELRALLKKVEATLQKG